MSDHFTTLRSKELKFETLLEKKNPPLCVDNNLQKCFQTDTLENTTAQIFLIVHCVKSIQIRSYFWSVFSFIWTEYGDLRSKSLYSVRIQEITDQK